MDKAKLVEASIEPPAPASAPARKDLLSTGSTLLNMACSGNPFGGFLRGSYYFLVGDSASGKTFIAMTCFAEASLNRRFKDYRLIFDNVEGGALMDWAHFFGQAAADRIEPPAMKDGQPVCSQTIEDFYYHLDDAIQSGKPFIYVLDSMDGLTSEDERDKFDLQKKATREGKDAPGSYGDGKAKKNSAGIRRLLGPLRDSGSILIIINQTRDNISGMGYEKKTRSGGHALRFYATVEMWSSIREKLKRTVRGKNRQVGVQIQIQIKKNRVTGKLHSVEVPIYTSLGIDDMESCVEYLLSEGHWTQRGPSLAAPEFDWKGSKEGLIQKIETEGREGELKKLVGDLWKDIEDACEINRKKRYQ